MSNTFKTYRARRFLKYREWKHFSLLSQKKGLGKKKEVLAGKFLLHKPINATKMKTAANAVTETVANTASKNSACTGIIQNTSKLLTF